MKISVQGHGHFYKDIFNLIYFRLTGSKIGSPEYYLKSNNMTFIFITCPSIFVPHDGNKSQLVELLDDGEVLFDVPMHHWVTLCAFEINHVKLNANLPHIFKWATRWKIVFETASTLCW